MIKIVSVNKKEDSRIVPMSDMKPGQVGITVNEALNIYKNHYVMRTTSTPNFEVMDLSDPRPNACWTKPNPTKVRLLNPDEKITLELSNDE